MSYNGCHQEENAITECRNGLKETNFFIFGIEKFIFAKINGCILSPVNIRKWMPSGRKCSHLKLRQVKTVYKNTENIFGVTFLFVL